MSAKLAGLALGSAAIASVLTWYVMRESVQSARESVSTCESLYRWRLTSCEAERDGARERLRNAGSTPASRSS